MSSGALYNFKEPELCHGNWIIFKLICSCNKQELFWSSCMNLMKSFSYCLPSFSLTFPSLAHYFAAFVLHFVLLYVNFCMFILYFQERENDKHQNKLLISGFLKKMIHLGLGWRYFLVKVSIYLILFISAPDRPRTVFRHV